MVRNNPFPNVADSVVTFPCTATAATPLSAPLLLIEHQENKLLCINIVFFLLKAESKIILLFLYMF